MFEAIQHVQHDIENTFCSSSLLFRIAQFDLILKFPDMCTLFGGLVLETIGKFCWLILVCSSTSARNMAFYQSPHTHTVDALVGILTKTVWIFLRAPAFSTFSVITVCFGSRKQYIFVFAGDNRSILTVSGVLCHATGDEGLCWPGL